MLPLQGVRVADFTVHAAGPFCTHQLSLLGAECIKIETAERPDIFRKPHPVYGRMGAATFDQVASNKLSIRLNLKHPRGVEIAKELVAISDIAIESFRPGVMDRLGLNYEALKAVNPTIVMVSISASGQTGPERGYAGYAPLFGAAGGLGTLTGYADGPPTEIRHVMDHSTGLNAVAATLAAYLRKTRTGMGQHVDIAAREVANAFIGDAMLAYSATKVPPQRAGNDMPGMAPNNVYRCAGEERWVSIAVGSDAEFQALARAVGTPQWLTDPRFADAASRWQNRAALDAELSAWTQVRTREAVTQTLQAAGVAAVPSYTAQDLADDPHCNQRGSIVEMREPDGAKRKAVGPPWRFSKTPAELARGTPALGEHEAYVYGDLLGLTQIEINTLVREKVIW
jgi:benzylsuccinate CoA-transferase BbsF subunit